MALVLRLCALVLLLAVISSAAAVELAPRPLKCYAVEASVDIAKFCSGAGGPPTRTCCRILVAVADEGGLLCLCRISVTPSMLTSGYGSADLLSLYSSCGGKLHIGMDIIRSCGAEGVMMPEQQQQAAEQPQEASVARAMMQPQAPPTVQPQAAPATPVIMQAAPVVQAAPATTAILQPQAAPSTSGIAQTQVALASPVIFQPQAAATTQFSLETIVKLCGIVSGAAVLLVLIGYVLAAEPGHRKERAEKVLEWILRRERETPAGLPAGIVAGPPNGAPNGRRC